MQIKLAFVLRIDMLISEKIDKIYLVVIEDSGSTF